MNNSITFINDEREQVRDKTKRSERKKIKEKEQNDNDQCMNYLFKSDHSSVLCDTCIQIAMLRKGTEHKIEEKEKNRSNGLKL